MNTAVAFIKTLDPSAGFATTNNITVNTTAIPDSWNRYSIQIVVDNALIGQVLQFGFAATATNFEPSGVFYDNVAFHVASTIACHAVAPGDLVINEIMPNPSAVWDSLGEWIEIYNATDAVINLNGLTLADNDIEAWDYVLLDSGGAIAIPIAFSLLDSAYNQTAVEVGKALSDNRFLLRASVHTSPLRGCPTSAK